MKKIYPLLTSNINYIVAVIGLGTIFLLYSAMHLKLDNAGLSYEDPGDPSFKKYQEYKKTFADDNLVIAAVGFSHSLTEPETIKSIQSLHQALMDEPPVKTLIDPTNFNSENLNSILGIKDFWQPESIDKLRKCLPGFAGMISPDLKTTAFAIQLNETEINGFLFKKRVDYIEGIFKKHFPDAEIHISGFPVLKAAFERYNLLNTAFYTLIGLLAGTVIALYIFKSLKVSMIVTISCLISSIWTAGTLSIFNKSFTVLSSISLCFIIIVSTTTVMHIVSKYYELSFSNESKNGLEILDKTLSIVLRPCFMCALTTSAGFVSLMISPNDLIRDTGLIIAVSVIFSFIITFTVTTFFLAWLKPPERSVLKRTNSDYVSRFLKNTLTIGFRKPYPMIVTGGILIVVFLIGAGSVKRSKQSMFPVSQTTREAVSMQFIRSHLSSGYNVSLILKPADLKADDSQDSSSKNVLASNILWRDLFELERRIISMKYVHSVDSMSSFISALMKRFPPGFFSPGKVIRMLEKKAGNEPMIRQFINAEENRIRIVIHLSDLPDLDLNRVISDIQAEAESVFTDTAEIDITGQAVIFEQQKKAVTDYQIKSLILALFLITILMMLQLRSVALGIISLIPNAVPLLTIFGLMGWLKIGLDPLMIFAAIISFGLSVDDSIHYLTQVKRELIKNNNQGDISIHLEKSYWISSRALLSTTVVILISSLAFLFSSFDHVFGFGVLVSSAAASALFGDLILLPAVIIKIKPLQNFIRRC